MRIPFFILAALFATTPIRAVDVISGGSADGTVVVSQDPDKQFSVGEKVCVGANKTDCGEVIKSTALDATIKLFPRATAAAPKAERKAPPAKKKVAAAPPTESAPVAPPAPATPPAPAPAPVPAPLVAAPSKRKVKKAGSNADAPLVVRPYRLTIDGESTFSDPNPAPQVMDERVARGPSLRRDPASLGTPKFRIGTDFDIGADYFMPGLQVQTALGRTVALGLHFAYNYQESRGTQRIWGLQGTLTVYGAEMAPYGLFAESRFGLYHLDATDAYGSESADNVALGQVFGWRAKIVPALALGGAVGAQYLVQSKTTRILDFSGLKPLATLELTLQF